MGFDPEWNKLGREVSGALFTMDMIKQNKGALVVPRLVIDNSFTSLPITESEHKDIISQTGSLHLRLHVPYHFEAPLDFEEAHELFHHQFPNDGIHRSGKF